MKEIIVIGGGLAGCEAALQIAKRKIKVKLYEMKPVKFSEAHSNPNFAEVVCSNSFKSNLITNACGLLKEELRRLGSELIKIADEVKVPAGPRGPQVCGRLHPRDDGDPAPARRCHQ